MSCENLVINLSPGQDATLTIPLSPPTAVGGEQYKFLMTKRFGGGSGLVECYVNSGYNGVSGMSVVNSGQGQFQITFPGLNTSGLEFGNYACTIFRTKSGFFTPVSDFYITLGPP